MKREFIGIMGKLICETEEVGETVVAEVEGKADFYTSAELTKILGAYLDRGKKKILLDLARLEYLDSSTLAALLNFHKKVKAKGGSLKLVKLGGEPRKVFRTSGFLDLFEVFEDREKALRSF